MKPMPFLRKTITIILCVTMLLTCLPLAGYAQAISSLMLLATGTFTLPASLKTIADEAFMGNTALRTLVVPDEVTSIGDRAFKDCSGLYEIEIPASVTSIGTDAFTGVADGFTIYGASGSYAEMWADANFIEFIDPSAPEGWVLADEDDFGYIVSGDTVTITSYFGEGGNIIIPDEIEGYPVVAIGEFVFGGYLTLTGVVIPDGVTDIGDYAFQSCENLASVTIPDSVTGIGELAFAECAGLINVVIPNGVISIGGDAFWNCTSLTSVNIPNSLTAISEYMFAECVSLESIIIPGGVLSIGEGAFVECTGLTNVSIQYGVVEIGNYAFENCASLASISIPGSVESIGDSAFWGCSSLASISIPGSVTVISDYAFVDCTSLTSVTIPNGVLSIGECAFWDCSNLVSASIPVSVESIGDGAFDGVSDEFIIYGVSGSHAEEWADDNGFEFIDPSAQQEPLSLAIEVSDSQPDIWDVVTWTASATGGTPAYEYLFELYYEDEFMDSTEWQTENTYSYEVDKLGQWRLEVTVYDDEGESTTDESVVTVSTVLPQGWTLADGGDFNYDEIVIGETISVYYAGDGGNIVIPRRIDGFTVVAIGEDAFYNCEELTGVIIPEGVADIGNNAFANCTGLTSVVIPDSVISIGDCAFENCASLASVTIPINVESIGDGAFDGVAETFIMYGVTGSPAEEWANNNGVTFMDIAGSVWPESEHPYADGFDHTWTYTAPDDTESVSLTFSANTSTEEDCDYIYIYDLNDVEIGKYSGTQLAGQTIEVDGKGFKVRLQSDEFWQTANAYYGFKLDNVVPKRAVPLTFVSLTAENDTVMAGEPLRWTMTTEGGKGTVYYDYSVLLNEDEVASGTVEAPSAIEYIPISAGEYSVSVVARDSGAAALPAQSGGAVTVTPSVSYPESAHPYASNFDYTWVYSAEENIGSLRVTFSDDTKTQSNYDVITLYSNTGDEIGKYSGTTLAGQTIEIVGNSFAIRLKTNASTQYYGFRITNIEKFVAGPLTFVSLTADKTKAKVGDLITWTMTTEGGRRPVSYEYTISMGGARKAFGTVTRPEAIEYAPMAVGDYTLSVIATDKDGNALPAETSAVRISARTETSPEEDFTTAVVAGNFVKITKYTGSDACVSIPETINGKYVDEIAASAFKGNTTITSVIIPDSIMRIGASAFEGCVNLAGVTYPYELMTVGNNGSVFKGCTKLTTIDLPYGITTLPENVFQGCDTLTHIEIPGSVKIIGDQAFMSCISLVSIVIPDSVTSIGSQVFQNCDGITYIEIPDSVESIGGHAFKGCDGLTSIVIPDSVTSIGGYAFNICDRLESVVLPDTLESIGIRAFSNCPNLISINYPSELKSVGGNIFEDCTKLTTIDLPYGITTLPANVFEGWNTLTHIDIPGSVKSIGNQAFMNCIGLPYIEIPDSVESIGIQAFQNCDGLTHIEIPDSVESIGGYAFKGCDGLTSIVIPDSVTSIGGYAFNICDRLESVVLPDTLESIGIQAFSNCPNLISINYPSELKSVGGNIFKDCTKLTTIDLPYGITTLPANVFEGWNTLTHIEIPSSVESIGSDAFRGCDGLTEIVIPEGVISLGSTAFKSCSHLTTVVLPDTLETIGAWAFTDCANLTNINYPFGLKTVGGNGLVFQNCTKLTTIDLPYGITTLPDNVFQGWNTLTHIEIPDSVESIGNDAFMSCIGLPHIEIPSSVERIGSNAFRGCDSLTEIVIPEGVISLGSSAFRDCSHLTTVVLPDTLETIGAWAFADCANLTNINYPFGLETVGGNGLVFQNCTKLTTIDLPYGITTLPANVFEGWNTLTHIEIPDSVTSIGSQAFRNCKALRNIWIPVSIETGKIGASAFAGITPANLTVHGVEGSYAQTYADDHDFGFSAVPFEFVPASLSGKVVDIYGVGLPGVAVTVYNGPTTNYPFGTTYTSSNGNWAMENVRLNGRYRVDCSDDGYRFGTENTVVTVYNDNTVVPHIIGGIGSNTQSGFAVSHGTVNGLTAYANGGRGMTITVVSTGEWTVESDSDWIGLSVNGGMSNDTFYTIIEKNNANSPRTGYVTVRCEGFKPAIIRVVQDTRARVASITANKPDAEAITNTSVVVTGLLTWGEGETASSYRNVGIQYGLVDGEWIATVYATLEAETGNISATVTGLETDEIYRFRIVAQHTATLRWMQSEPVTARIQEHCEHRYGSTVYAYDNSVKAYYDLYLEKGNTFLPTVFVEEEETATSHSIRHPFIRVCSLCDSFEVVYMNEAREHTLETVTDAVYKNITAYTHDKYQRTRVMCTTDLHDTMCGYIRSENEVLLEAGVNHAFNDGVCSCGECNVVWTAALRGTLYIDVAVASGHPDKNSDYLFIAEDADGFHYSKTIPAGRSSISLGIVSDLNLLRAKTYSIYIIPKDISLTEDNRSEYYLGDIQIPLFNGNMVTKVYSGDLDMSNEHKLYVGDEIQINWDGSYGVDHAHVTVKLNTNEVFSETYDYSGPGIVRLDSFAIGASEGDALTVTVTVDPAAALSAIIPRANPSQPVSSSWTGTFVPKPRAGYVIELDWNGARTDVTDQRVHMTTANGAPSYFGLRAYLNGNDLVLTESDCAYEWRFNDAAVVETDGDYEVMYVYDLTIDPSTNYFYGYNSNLWILRKKNDGFSFSFNGNGDKLKNWIGLYEKNSDVRLAYVQIQTNKYGIVITGADVGYSAGDREYDGAVSISNELYNSWYTSASKAERRLWFDLNFKRDLIDITVPSNTVENFLGACSDSFAWNLRYGGVLLTLKIGDFLGNAASDAVDYAVETIKFNTSWPAALYSDIKYGDGNFNERFAETQNLLKNMQNSLVDGRVVNSFTNDDAHTDAIIDYLKMIADEKLLGTNKSNFEKTTAQSVMDGLANLKNTVTTGVKKPLSLMIELVQGDMEMDYADVFNMEYAGTTLGKVQVDVRIGTKFKTIDLEKAIDANQLKAIEDVSGRDAVADLLGELSEGVDVNAQKVEKQGLLWTLITPDSKVDLYNEMYPGSKMMDRIGDFLKVNNVDAWLDAADAGINGYKAWTTAEQYDKLLEEFEDYLKELKPGENAWVQDVLDELADAASDKAVSILRRIGDVHAKKSLKKLASDACKEVIEEALKKLLGKSAAQAVKHMGTLAGAAWAGIELGNMLSNASGSVGKIPSVSAVIKLYDDAQYALYRAMNVYTSSPSTDRFKDLKMKAELYNILKGSAIVSINAVFRAEQESLIVRFTNWQKLKASYQSAFFASLFSGDWEIFANVRDERKDTISDIEKSISAELDQMKTMIQLLFPKV